MDVSTRLVTQDDVPALVKLLRSNRDALAPWDPTRTDDYFTADTQHGLVTNALTRHTSRLVVPLIITADDELAGRININDVVRGAFQSAHLGYWVDHAHQGRGVATAAVAQTIRRAFADLALHCLQADTLVHNAASRAVLARNGFVEIGRAALPAHRWPLARLRLAPAPPRTGALTPCRRHDLHPYGGVTAAVPTEGSSCGRSRDGRVAGRLRCTSGASVH